MLLAIVNQAKNVKKTSNSVIDFRLRDEQLHLIIQNNFTPSYYFHDNGIKLKYLTFEFFHRTKKSQLFGKNFYFQIWS